MAGGDSRRPYFYIFATVSHTFFRMIIYFSATGNTAYVADCLSMELRENVVDMETQPADSLAQQEGVAIVLSPTYFFGAPPFVATYLSGLNPSAFRPQRLYVVCTFGTYSGQCAQDIRRVLEKKKYSVDALFGVKMPDTWTPVFDLSNTAQQERIVKDSASHISEIAQKIMNDERGDFAPGRFPRFVAWIAGWIYEKSRQTSHLHVLDGKCNGCGLCARRCPSNSITQREGKPLWQREKCLMCLRCLHGCPQFAIQYDNKTQKHGQWLLKNNVKKQC